MNKIISLFSRRKNFRWSLLLLPIILSSCEKWDLGVQEFPHIQTGKFEFGSTPWEVKLYGEISDLTESGFVEHHGHVWSLSPKRPPTLEDKIGQTIFGKRGNGNFQTDLGGLVPRQTYFYRAYIIYNNQVVYAENVEQFNTESLNPVLIIDSLARQGETSVIKVFCTISNLPLGLRIKSFGVTWGEESSPEISSAQLVPQEGITVSRVQVRFESELQLSGGDIYLRPYLVVGDEVFYGDSWFYHQGDVWIEKGVFPGMPRRGAFAFAIGSRGYVGGGTDGVYYPDFWEYDAERNYWTQKADFPGKVRWHAVGFSIDNKGYIGTGFDGYEQKNDFWEYDPKSDLWTQKADVPGQPRGNAVGFSIGPKGYIGTGNQELSAPAKDFWEYDPRGDSWTRKADFPGDARAEAVGFSIGPKGYVGLGADGAGEEKADFWEYDPLGDRWRRMADYPGGARRGATGFSIGLKGYVGAGGTLNPLDPDDRIISADFWEYDALFGAWRPTSGLSNDLKRIYAVGFSIDSRGYIATGALAGGHANDLWMYVP